MTNNTANHRSFGIHNAPRSLSLLLLSLFILAASLPFVAIAQTGSAHSGSQTGQTIGAIEFQGLKRVDEASLRILLQSQVNTPFVDSTIDSDIRKLYHTGYFNQVLALREGRGAKNVLVFKVEERPSVRQIKITGNDEVSEDKLKELLNISARKFLDKGKIKSGIDQAVAYYHTQGFRGTKISYNVEPVDGSEQVDLLYKVEEGEENVIATITFEGNQAISEDELRDAMQTREYSWWRSWITGRGDFIEEQLEQDHKSLAHLYLTKGHIDIQISKPQIKETEDGLQVTFQIQEGQSYQFGKVTAVGRLIGNSVDKTLEGVEIKPGDTFDVDKLREGTFKVTDKYTDIGYAYANVEPNTAIDRKEKKVAVAYTIDEGEKVDVDRINISGNQKTRDNVIRRALKIDEQDLFSSSKIRRSQELLQRLGYFDEVTITPQKADAAGKVDLLVNVREASTGAFTIGAGISSGDGFIFSSQISENNLMGTGNSAALDLSTGSKRERYVLSFYNPRVDDSYFSAGTKLFKTALEYDDFEKSQMGGSVTVGYPWWFFTEEPSDDVSMNLTYELANVDISDVDLDASQYIKDEEGESTSSSLKPGIVRNTINNPLDPSDGSRQVASIEVAGLGGDEDFWLGELSNTIYRPLWKSPIGTFVVSQRTVFNYGESNNDDDFPLFRRYFPGGINSVRGYQARTMGPKDENGDLYGGSKQLVMNFDLLYPIVESAKLKGVLFFDIGEAFADDENIELGELRKAADFGIRWGSPLAPIRLEFGIPLDKEDDDDSFVTNFSFGAPL